MSLKILKPFIVKVSVLGYLSREISPTRREK